MELWLTGCYYARILYLNDKYVRDSILQIQWLLFQHRPYVHAKHMISCCNG